MIALIEPAVAALGYELADVELSRGGGVLRLYIDCAAGITLDDCETVSRQVSDLLDVEDPIPGEYTLEVSSPGLDRRLVKKEHFDRFAGSAVKVRLRRLIDGRRRFKGTLVGRKGDEVIVEDSGTNFSIPLAEIDSARLVPDL